jgi:hypothetical protein
MYAYNYISQAVSVTPFVNLGCCEITFNSFISTYWKNYPSKYRMSASKYLTYNKKYLCLVPISYGRQIYNRILISVMDWIFAFPQNSHLEI